MITKSFAVALAYVSMFGIHAAKADDGSSQSAACYQGGANCAANYAAYGFSTGVECFDAWYAPFCPIPVDAGITTPFEAYQYYANPGSDRSGGDGVHYCNGRLGCMDRPEDPDKHD
ncbi:MULTISPECIES: hypothetical protein [unclassified Sphingomonas]|uniref:hypothetical protein n=1 Tax=unclassified Sphingomonas TaxID=196159 RepID=UPI0022B50FED|nr:hypothetical protein [Sphingomonas sp. NIBR02145]WHU03122.1 hypothetical protein O3305_00460 [Sphingomonas sp. NIBR02145]